MKSLKKKKKKKIIDISYFDQIEIKGLSWRLLFQTAYNNQKLELF